MKDDKKGRQLPKVLRDFKLYKKYYALTLMFIPVVIYFIIFKYIPMGGIVMAFQDFRLGDGILNSPWVGLKNFEKIFKMPTFIRAFRNTLIISVLKLICGFPAPIILAILLNEVRHEGYKRVMQTVTYLPHFLSWVIMAGILQQLLSPNNGAVNSVLMNVFGLDRAIYFLGDNAHFRGTLVVTDIWKGVGWGSVIYLAAITGIDPTLYEAATCDGATRWQRMKFITFPCILPTISVMLILSLGSILDAGFDQVLNLYSAAVYESGDIIDTYVYRYGLQQMNYSIGAAVGLFKNLIGFALVLITNKITKRINGNGIW